MRTAFAVGDAPAGAKSPAFRKDKLCLKDQLFGRAHLARHSVDVGKSSLGALLRERKVTGRDASLPAPLLSAFGILVARGTVGALPQTPQGTLSLDPARGRRKGTKSPLDPLRAIGLVALSCSFRVQLLMLRLSPCLLPQLSVKNQMNLEIIPLLPESSAPRCCGGSFPPAAA